MAMLTMPQLRSQSAAAFKSAVKVEKLRTGRGSRSDRNLKKRNPVHASGLHGDAHDATTPKPVSCCFQVGCESGKASNRPRVSIRSESEKKESSTRQWTPWRCSRCHNSEASQLLLSSRL